MQTSMLLIFKSYDSLKHYLKYNMSHTSYDLVLMLIIGKFYYLSPLLLHS